MSRPPEDPVRQGSGGSRQRLATPLTALGRRTTMALARWTTKALLLSGGAAFLAVSLAVPAGAVESLATPAGAQALPAGGAAVPADDGLPAAEVPLGEVLQAPRTAPQVPPQTQPADTLRELRLVDGSVLIGKVVEEDESRVIFETITGVRMEVPRDRIQSMVASRGQLVDGQFWPQDPNRTRLLVLSPTGRTLPKGEGYLSAFWIFFPFVGYGVTDNFTFAAGTPVIPEVIGRVIYLAPKLRVFSRPSVDLSVGALALFATQELDEGSGGLLYGVGTFGEQDRSFSAGIGWAYTWGGDDPWISSEPLIMLGGEYRVGVRSKLLTENFFVPGESGAFLTGGMRLFGERLSVDFGIGAVVGLDSDSDGIPWFPVLNFVWNFGGGR
jgi:hypothetical protein